MLTKLVITTREDMRNSMLVNRNSFDNKIQFNMCTYRIERLAIMSELDLANNGPKQKRTKHLLKLESVDFKRGHKNITKRRQI